MSVERDPIIDDAYPAIWPKGFIANAFKFPKINPKKEVIIDSKFDHRIAMSFLCLGLLMENGVKVKNAETISTSFPNFYGIMKSIGAKLKK